MSMDMDKKRKAVSIFMEYLFGDDEQNIYECAAKAQDEKCAEYFLSIIKNNCYVYDGRLASPAIDIEDLKPVYFSGDAVTALRYLPVVTYGHSIYVARFCNSYRDSMKK